MPKVEVVTLDIKRLPKIAAADHRMFSELRRGFRPLNSVMQSHKNKIMGYKIF